MVASGLSTNFDKLINMHVKGIQGNEKLDILMITVTSLGDLSTLVIIGYHHSSNQKNGAHFLDKYRFHSDFNKLSKASDWEASPSIWASNICDFP